MLFIEIKCADYPSFGSHKANEERILHTDSKDEKLTVQNGTQSPDSRCFQQPEMFGELNDL